MINVLEYSSPFYKAYAAQADAIDSAIKIAVYESASKMGGRASELFSISVEPADEKLVP